MSPTTPDTQTNNELHTRISVLEALILERNTVSAKNHQDIAEKLDQIQRDLTGLKIKSGVAAALVSFVVVLVTRLMFPRA